jgi:hypothetical protein
MSHETLRLWSLLRKGAFVCIVFLLTSLALEIRTYLAASATRDVTLVWSKSPEQDVAGYNVYYGPVSRYADTFDAYLHAENVQPADYELQGPEVHYVLNSIDENISYWVAITAYDHNNNESEYSNEKKIGTPSDVNTRTGSQSGGCQTAPISLHARVEHHTAWTGWGFVFLVVPAWILILRSRFDRSDGPR